MARTKAKRKKIEIAKGHARKALEALMDGIESHGRAAAHPRTSPEMAALNRQLAVVMARGALALSTEAGMDEEAAAFADLLRSLR